MEYGLTKPDSVGHSSATSRTQYKRVLFTVDKLSPSLLYSADFVITRELNITGYVENLKPYDVRIHQADKYPEVSGS